jgi:hypothetical protein
MKIFHNQQGISILGILFLGVIIILVLSYYHISIQTVAESPEAQGNFNYVTSIGHTIWHSYLAGPVTYLWREIWVKIFWKSFVNNMEHLRDGEPTEPQNNSPTVSY